MEENYGPKGSMRTEEFLNLLVTNQVRIRSYISALAPNHADGDDLMQETITVMWRKFDKFHPGSDFAAWGVKIAYYNILRFRASKGRSPIQFSEALFTQFLDVVQEKYGCADERLQALRKCVDKLESTDQRLLKMRYQLNSTVKSVASQTGQSIKHIYRALARIHGRLHSCVRRVLVEEGSV